MRRVLITVCMVLVCCGMLSVRAVASSDNMSIPGQGHIGALEVEETENEETTHKKETVQKEKATIDSKNGSASNPKTGDTVSILAYIMLLAGSVIFIIGMMVKKKKMDQAR